MRVRRAILYMPGSDWRKIEKATRLDVDSICMDLEDGVALSRKEEARETVVKALKTLDFGSTEKLVRINAVGSGMEEADLDVIVPFNPDGIIIPKVSSAADVQWVSERLVELEKTIPDLGEPIHILALIESAIGIVNLKEIANSDSRLKVLIFGAEDLAGDVGAVRTPEGNEVLYARSAVVTHAAAYNLQAIDMVATDFKGMDTLFQESRRGVELGYDGRQIIHPKQIGEVQRAFTPSDKEIEKAKVLIEAFTKHQERGVGGFEIDGKMVDMPNLKAAENVLRKARAAGKLD